MTYAIEVTVLFFVVWFVFAFINRMIAKWRMIRRNVSVVEAAATEVKPLAIAPTKAAKFTLDDLKGKKRDELRRLCGEFNIKWWKGSKGTNMPIPEMKQHLLGVAIG